MNLCHLSQVVSPGTGVVQYLLCTVYFHYVCTQITKLCYISTLMLLDSDQDGVKITSHFVNSEEGCTYTYTHTRLIASFCPCRMSVVKTPRPQMLLLYYLSTCPQFDTRVLYLIFCQIMVDLNLIKCHNKFQRI